MAYEFTVMTQGQAENIASSWHYEGIYSFYDMEADEEDLAAFLNPQERGDHYYMVKKRKEEVGFFYFNHKDEAVEVGLGMKPERTGEGGGLSFLRAGMNFARMKYEPKELNLAVATFNSRAIKVYQQAGFIPDGTCMQETNGSLFEFVKMSYACAGHK
ncbi:GNAT family protein [Shouchella sp. 1P09AA]|uniref:GNAT family N-acetyltransferase n=1 Tax=unclassified Shouchella TaxID=2893065 RepID=UPI0039A2460A